MASDKQRIKTVLPTPVTTSQIAKKNGRPLKEVNEVLVTELAALQCTKEEIARVCGCSKDVLYERFRHCLDKGADEGKASLRRLQWKSAQAGNVVMQVWLGKQWLGQKDKSPEEVGNTVINVQVQEVPT